MSGGGAAGVEKMAQGVRVGTGYGPARGGSLDDRMGLARPRGLRTSDLKLRRLALYPTELRARADPV